MVASVSLRTPDSGLPMCRRSISWCLALAARYRRVCRRRGPKRALLAVGHTLLVIVYQVLKRRAPYRELGADYYDRLEPERLARQLVRRLEQLGHKVTLATKDTEASTDLANAGQPE